jgi:hypothetical protein
MSIASGPHSRSLGKSELRARARGMTWHSLGDWTPVTDDAWRAWRRTYRQAMRQLAGVRSTHPRFSNGARRPVRRTRRTRRVARVAASSDGSSSDGDGSPRLVLVPLSRYAGGRS